MTQTLLSIGHGYSARALEERLMTGGWSIIATTRSEEKASELEARGIKALVWPGTDLPLEDVTHVLISVSPQGSDPVLEHFADRFERATHLRWISYLSTVGVYGDHKGRWVDEESLTQPVLARSRARLEAEAAWQAVAARAGVPLHIFRLAGIYGPGRGPFEKLRKGQAQRVIKPGQYFSRIHYEDIGLALELSILSGLDSRIFNLCDDSPAPPQDVLEHAAQLLGIPVPPEIDFEKADLSPMARSFYSDNKRVRNDRIKRELGWQPRYPDYRRGLAAILAAEGRLQS